MTSGSFVPSSHLVLLRSILHSYAGRFSFLISSLTSSTAVPIQVQHSFSQHFFLHQQRLSFRYNLIRTMRLSSVIILGVQLSSVLALPTSQDVKIDGLSQNIDIDAILQQAGQEGGAAGGGQGNTPPVRVPSPPLASVFVWINSNIKLFTRLLLLPLQLKLLSNPRYRLHLLWLHRVQRLVSHTIDPFICHESY